jgi:hypothetical protein
MMDKKLGRYIWGIALVLVGVLFLLQQFNVIGDALDLLWTIAMGAAGVAFLVVYALNQEQWWAAIPGMTLLGLTAAALGDQLPLFPGTDWWGSLFLAFIGAGFWLVFARKPEHWWAIIPGGVLVTLGVVSLLEDAVLAEEGVFFLGLGLTFGLVGLLPRQRYSTRWAYIPGAVLAILGLLLFVDIGSTLVNFWPVILILVGGYILYQSLFQAEQTESHEEIIDEGK